MRKRKLIKDRSHFAQPGYSSHYDRVTPHINLAFSTLAVALMAALSNILDNIVVGEISICIYVIFATTKKIDSSVTFKMALILLGGIAGLSVLSPGNELADILTTYMYLLLIGGAVQSVIELWSLDRKLTRAEIQIAKQKAKESVRKRALARAKRAHTAAKNVRAKYEAKYEAKYAARRPMRKRPKKVQL